MTSSYSSSNYKKYDNFTVTDNFGNTYLFIRSGKGLFNIAKCEVNTDGHIDDNDGLVPNAVPFHPEEVAYLVAQEEERYASLERIDALLKELIKLCPWISSPRTRRGKQSVDSRFGRGGRL